MTDDYVEDVLDDLQDLRRCSSVGVGDVDAKVKPVVRYVVKHISSGHKIQRPLLKTERDYIHAQAHAHDKLLEKADGCFSVDDTEFKELDEDLRQHLRLARKKAVLVLQENVKRLEQDLKQIDGLIASLEWLYK